MDKLTKTPTCSTYSFSSKVFT